jgi:hypothetical protein
VQCGGCVHGGVLHDGADGLLNMARADRQRQVRLSGVIEVSVAAKQVRGDAGVTGNPVAVGGSQRARGGTVDVKDTDWDGVQMDREREDRSDTAGQCRCGEAWLPEAGAGVDEVGDRHRPTGGDGVHAWSLAQDDLQVFEPVALRAAFDEDDTRTDRYTPFTSGMPRWQAGHKPARQSRGRGA